MFFAEKHLLLPRPPLDLIARIKNFIVAECDGIFTGCSALREYGNGLYEVRSLAVQPQYQKQGIASKLVQTQMRSLREHKIDGEIRLFALTYQVAFFRNLGFQTVEKTLFPEKIWSDCEQCPKKNRCDETAVLISIRP